MNKTIGNIVGEKPLNEKNLNKLVFKVIGNDECEYISKESKSYLLAYNGKDDKSLENAKTLWKNLLIDAICILKMNDSREKLYIDCNKSFSAENFTLVRKLSSYGINEIEKYFDDFVEFERALYGTDQHYRDHVDHVLQVWAMGISLIGHHDFILSDDFKLDKTAKFHFRINEYVLDNNGEIVLDENGEDKIDPEKLLKKNKIISESEYWAMWTISALCHDLGYPIEKTSKINKQAKKIISHFGNMNFSELNYSFDIFNTFLVDKFLNVISSKAYTLEKENFTMVQTKYRDKFAKTLEDNQHGIFSSLLIYKNLTYFLETDYYVNKSKLDPEDLRQFYIRKEILRSIAGHTCPKIYHINLNTLSFMLILCDELQEWDRPNFDAFRFNLEGKAPDVILKDFDMNGKQKIHIIFDYKHEINRDDKLHIISSKYKTIHCLLRSAKDDKNRKIDFQWEIYFTDERFYFIFDSKKDSFELLRVSHQEFDKNTSTFKDPEPYPLYK